MPKGLKTLARIGAIALEEKSGPFVYLAIDW
jgi:hypothetical protein